MISRSDGLMLFALFLAEVTASFETSMIYAATGPLLLFFGDPVKVGWLITAYLLTATVASALAARIGDLWGRRGVVLWLLGIALIGSILSGSGASYAVILVGRTIQGAAFAILPLCCGIVRARMSPERVPLAIGIVVAGASGGSAVGLVIGGLIVDRFGWPAIFIASAVMAAISFLFVLLLVPRDSPAMRAKRLNIGSGLLFVPAVVVLLVYISNIGRSGWLSGEQAVLLFLGVGLLGAWWNLSLRERNPLLDVRLLRDRTVALTNLIFALLGLGAMQLVLIFSALLQAPEWTGIGLGASSTTAGLVKLPSNLLSLIAAPFAGWIVGRRGGRAAMLAGIGTALAGWALALFMHASIWQVGAALIIASFGTTMAYAAAPSLIVASVPEERSGEATGMLMVVRSAAMAVGAQVMALILSLELVHHGSASYPGPRATLGAMGWAAGLILIAGGVALFLVRKSWGQQVRTRVAGMDGA